MTVDDIASPYSNGPAARMVLVMSGLAYIAVGGCWFWVFRAYPALALVAFGLVPLAAERWNSRPLVRCFLLGCCLSVFYFALEFTRAMFRQYKASLHPLFWAFPIFAALLPLALWVLVKWLDQPPVVPKSRPAFPLDNFPGSTSSTRGTPVPTSAAALEPKGTRPV